jgi:hypothetical protein
VKLKLSKLFAFGTLLGALWVLKVFAAAGPGCDAIYDFKKNTRYKRFKAKPKVVTPEKEVAKFRILPQVMPAVLKGKGNENIFSFHESR